MEGICYLLCASARGINAPRHGQILRNFLYGQSIDFVLNKDLMMPELIGKGYRTVGMDYVSVILEK